MKNGLPRVGNKVFVEKGPSGGQEPAMLKRSFEHSDISIVEKLFISQSQQLCK